MLRKISYVWPVVSVIGLSVIGIVILNPSININKVHAEDDAVVYEVEPYELTDDGVILEWDDRDSDYQSIQGDNGEVLYRYNRFKVSADNIEKYQILANIMDTANGNNGNKLIGYTNSQYNITNGYSIDAISNENGVKGSSLQSSTVSQWGYNISLGDISTTAGLANLVYKAVPTATQSTVGLTDTVESLNNQTFTIAFAANIADDKPAGSYRASVGVSVVVEPRVVVTWDNIQYMQDMTSEICSSAPLNVQKTLTDSRDGNTYTIARIKNQTNNDALCWMTQNLRIINKSISSVDSDTISNFTIPASNLSGFDSSGQYQPRAYYGNNTAYGAYYNWYTATAGTGVENVTSGTTNANGGSSICPKGWRLPTGASGGEFYNLLNGFTKGAGITVLPYNFVYGGGVSFNNALSGIGSYGYYWSATAVNSTRTAILYFSSSEVNPLNNISNSRNLGHSVRCVAR